MRSSKSRSRNKNNRQRTLGNIINRVFDSSGPEGKVRGTPQQIIDKYLTLARDAQLSNDRVAEQSFLQHAEHYTRLLSEAQREMAERQQYNQQPNQNHRQNGDDDRDGDNNNNNNNGRDHGYRDNNDRDQPARHYDREEQNPAPAPQDSASREFVAPQDHAQNPQPADQSQQEQPRRGRSRRAKDENAGETAAPPSEVRQETVDLGLPAAFAPDDNEESGPISTPETADRPKPRSRAPRSATPRPRKKKDAEEASADSDNGVPADGSSS